MKSRERLTETLRIRTDKKTIKKFKKFVVDGDFRSYHEALNWLLDNCGGKRRVLDEELRFL